MPSNDLLIAFLFMAVLFVRQIFILKQPSKINYSPIMLSMGGVSGLLHFITSSDSTNFVLLLKESLFPVLVAILFYLVINIIQQTQNTQDSKMQTKVVEDLAYQILDLKDFIYNLETRMVIFSQEDKVVQENIQEKSRNELKVLESIQRNQEAFLEKFNKVEGWQKNIIKALDEFTHVEVPELDDIVHKHIDILRVSEQGHFNQLKMEIEKTIAPKIDFKNDIEELKQNIFNMRGLSDDIAQSITKHTLQQLSEVTRDFESQVLHLKSHTEAIKTSLHEGENTLSGIRVQSEMIMKQMRLSSDKMQELKAQNESICESYEIIKDLTYDVESIKKEYLKSRIQLSDVVEEFKHSESEQIAQMKKQIDSLSELLTQKIEESIKQLREHYHIADAEVPKSVQMLSQKTKILQGYAQVNNETQEKKGDI